MTPMPAPRVLDAYFLEARSKILDLAAVLDRLDRGEGSMAADGRVEKVRRAILSLLEQEPGRAERVQKIFSMDYDPDWKRPQPRY